MGTPHFQTAAFNEVLTKSQILLSEPNWPPQQRLTALCELLREEVSHYDWVGFYWVEAEEADMLRLGPYSGAETEHTRIPFGKGICGQAAQNRDTFTIQDVSQEDNYLACSVETQAEIVLPIFAQGQPGQLIGELDIDSHQLNPFNEEDEPFLKVICERVAELEGVPGKV